MSRLASFAFLGLVAGCGEVIPAAPLPPPPPPLPVTVTVGPDGVTVGIGGKLQFQALSTSTVTGWDWSVSVPALATISSNGLLTGVALGTVQVRACAFNAPSICGAAEATINNSVGGAPGVTVTPATPIVSVGQTVEFMVTSTNFTTPGWTWQAIDPAVATITDTGFLTARRAGVTVVVVCATPGPRYCGSVEVRVQ